MGKSTISMAIFNSYVKLPEGTEYSIEPLIPIDPPRRLSPSNITVVSG